MKLFTQKKKGHVGGTWFTTNNPTNGSAFDYASGGGVSDAGELVVVLVFFAIVEVLLRVGRWLFRWQDGSGSFGAYQGFVYCQVYNNGLRFFKTFRGTSRTILKPAAITRPLNTLASFKTITSTPPKVALKFSDGFEVELFSVDSEAELAKFRELVNSVPTNGQK